MNYWSTMFIAAVVLLFAVPLLPALLEWRYKKDAEPLKVVREHDGNIKHFAIRFRQFLADRFPEIVDGGAHIAEGSGQLPGGDRYRVLTESSTAPSGESCTDLLLGPASLKLGSAVFYEKEVYAVGAVQAGESSTFRAVLAGGDLSLGADSAVLRWAHSDRKMNIGAKARLFGRISADEAITLASEARFSRMQAPRVMFGPSFGTPAVRPPAVTARAALPVPDKLLANSAGRWLFAKSFEVPDASSHQGDLVTRGDLRIGNGSLIEGSLKSSGDLELGADVRIAGALVCSGTLTIGPGCVIKGPIVSEKKIEIRSGTVVGSAAAPTTITAPEIRVEEGALAHGTVWARDIGYVAPIL